MLSTLYVLQTVIGQFRYYEWYFNQTTRIQGEFLIPLTCVHVMVWCAVTTNVHLNDGITWVSNTYYFFMLSWHQGVSRNDNQTILITKEEEQLLPLYSIWYDPVADLTLTSRTRGDILPLAWTFLQYVCYTHTWLN